MVNKKSLVRLSAHFGLIILSRCLSENQKIPNAVPIADAITKMEDKKCPHNIGDFVGCFCNALRREKCTDGIQKTTAEI